jgi:hypothetical protein
MRCGCLRIPSAGGLTSASKSTSMGLAEVVFYRPRSAAREFGIVPVSRMAWSTRPLGPRLNSMRQRGRSLVAARLRHRPVTPHKTDQTPCRGVDCSRDPTADKRGLDGGPPARTHGRSGVQSAVEVGSKTRRATQETAGNAATAPGGSPSSRPALLLTLPSYDSCAVVVDSRGPAEAALLPNSLAASAHMRSATGRVIRGQTSSAVPVSTHFRMEAPSRSRVDSSSARPTTLR